MENRAKRWFTKPFAPFLKRKATPVFIPETIHESHSNLSSLGDSMQVSLVATGDDIGLINPSPPRKECKLKWFDWPQMPLDIPFHLFIRGEYGKTVSVDFDKVAWTCETVTIQYLLIPPFAQGDAEGFGIVERRKYQSPNNTPYFTVGDLLYIVSNFYCNCFEPAESVDFSQESKPLLEDQSVSREELELTPRYEWLPPETTLREFEALRNGDLGLRIHYGRKRKPFIF